MKRSIITICEGGAVSVPSGKVMMTDFEIAQLLGVTLAAVRGAIGRLLNGRQVRDCGGAVVCGSAILPEYFGLEVVIAIAFQVDGYEADIFRRYVLGRLTASVEPPIYISINNFGKDKMLN